MHAEILYDICMWSGVWVLLIIIINIIRNVFNIIRGFRSKKPSFPLEQKKVYKFWSYAHSTSTSVYRIQFYTRRWG